MQALEKHEDLHNQKLEAIRFALAHENTSRIPALLQETSAADIAELLSDLDEEDAFAVFFALDEAQRAQAFSYLNHDRAERLLSQITHPGAAQILDQMAPDDRARFFKRLPEETRTKLFPLLAQAERNDLRRLLSFEEGTAGSVMSTDYATVLPTMTASQAVEHLRRIAPRSETIYTVFVIDDERSLLGVVTLVDLISAWPSRRVEEIMRHDVVAVSSDQDREEVARIVAKYDFIAIPVVDGEGHLVGIVTHDDVLDVLEAEQAEDFERASGLEPDETPYDQATVGQLFRRRVLWLLGLMLAGLLASSVIAAFEDALATAVALAFFIPVVTGSGGNTGTQSATLIIRGLATGSLRLHDWALVFFKELTVGAILGAAMAATIFVVGMIWPGAQHVAPVVGATMVTLVIWANLVGALMPLVLRRIGVDPAVAGAPLVATMVDASGLLIYFTIARLLLPGV